MSEDMPINFESIEIDGKEKYLYGAYGQKRYPLYVFSPLKEACAGRYQIPFAPHWKEYDMVFAMLYIPVPYIEQSVNGIRLTRNIRDRDINQPPDPDRKWDQSSYKGWPLYYLSGHDKKVEKGNHPSMFEPVTADIEQVYFPDVDTDMPETSPPGPCLGP